MVGQLCLWGIVYHGTIYLLFRMMKMGLLDKEEILVLVDEMIHKGWGCFTELYADILKLGYLICRGMNSA